MNFLNAPSWHVPSQEELAPLSESVLKDFLASMSPYISPMRTEKLACGTAPIGTDEERARAVLMELQSRGLFLDARGLSGKISLIMW